MKTTVFHKFSKTIHYYFNLMKESRKQNKTAGHWQERTVTAKLSLRVLPTFHFVFCANHELSRAQCPSQNIREAHDNTD